MSTCCDQHIEGPPGTCCMDDCVPCCGACPTCPTTHNYRGAGALPRRQRGERGDSGLLGSLIVIIVLIAVFQVVFGIDLLRYFASAVHWTEDLVREIGDRL